MTLIPGVKITLNGTTYIVPALTLAQVRQLQPNLELLRGLTNTPTPEQLNALGEVFAAAFGRNYPDMVPMSLEEMIDLRDMRSVLGAIMGVSGLVEKEAGEA